MGTEHINNVYVNVSVGREGSLDLQQACVCVKICFAVMAGKERFKCVPRCPGGVRSKPYWRSKLIGWHKKKNPSTDELTQSARTLSS